MMYSEKQKNALSQLEALIDREGSQNKVAKLVGVTGAVLSQLRTGKYPGDVDAQFDKLIEYFNLKDEVAQRVVAIDKDYVPTSISEQVQDYIRNCQMLGGLMAISGDAGIGKTRAIRKFSKENPTSTFQNSQQRRNRGVGSALSLEESYKGSWIGFDEE